MNKKRKRRRWREIGVAQCCEFGAVTLDEKDDGGDNSGFVVRV